MKKSDKLDIAQDDTLTIDMIDERLAQAKAVMALITTNGENLVEGFTLNHKIIMDALWCVSSLIDQACDLTSTDADRQALANSQGVWL